MDRIVFLSGLPRSGSTLLCNLLAQHPQVAASPTSPLYVLVETLRRTWSDEESLLAQLDADFPRVYTRLLRSTRAFIAAWCSDGDAPVVVDKHRGWLFAVETLRELLPDFQLVVCLRDLRDVYASIERQHRKTLLLTYADRLEQNLVDARAGQLFAPAGVIGGPLRALYNLADVADVRDHLYFWRYEDFVANPGNSTERLLRWLGLVPAELDPQRLRQVTHEADSYYRFKYPHRLAPGVTPSAGFRDAPVSPRILAAIARRFAWYYRSFYQPGGVVELAADPKLSAAASGEGGLFADLEGEQE